MLPGAYIGLTNESPLFKVCYKNCDHKEQLYFKYKLLIPSVFLLRYLSM